MARSERLKSAIGTIAAVAGIVGVLIISISLMVWLNEMSDKKKEESLRRMIREELRAAEDSRR